MKKSGLHKQIASIFDGGSGTPAAVINGPTGQQTETVIGRFACDAQAPQGAKSVAQTSDAPDTSAARNTARLHRPMPLPRQHTQPRAAHSSSVLTQFKKAAANASCNPRQKKMAVLMVFLAVTFITVLFVSLGGIGTGKKVSDKPSESKDKLTETAPVAKAGAWKAPQALPESMRDPMKPAAPATQSAPATPGDSPQNGMIVKGIVFSQSQPSALINNEIVKEGQVVNGVTVARIDKNQVEFESNGKRWTQPVQR